MQQPDQKLQERKNALATTEKTASIATRRKRGTRAAKLNDATVEVKGNPPVEAALVGAACDRAEMQIANAANAYTKTFQEGIPKLLDHMNAVDDQVARLLLEQFDNALLEGAGDKVIEAA